MNLKQYQLGEIKYQYSLQSKKWEFLLPSLNTVFLAKCPGRNLTAQKVAKILVGAMKRGSVDGLARNAISRLGVI